LAAGGSKLEDVIKWIIYEVAGQPPQPTFEVFQRVWGNRSDLPLITYLFVSGLAHPDYSMGLDAVAVVPEP
jgi:enamine deaminase RidA (YjgF/YER057c/UK114 family)